MRNNDRNMQCEEALEILSAAHDGELTVGESLRLEKHLSGCPSCAQAFSRIAQLDRRMKLETFDNEELTVETGVLWNKISDAMDAHDAQRQSAPAVAPGRPAVGRGRRSFLLAGGAVAVFASAGIGLDWFGSRSPDVIGEAVSDYLTFRAGGMTLNVVDKGPRDLRRWLTERVDFDVSVSPVSPPGFDLVGGRLCSFLNRRLVFVYYQKGDAGVSVYMMTDDGLTLPRKNLVEVGQHEVAVSQVNGVSTAAWHANDLIFTVVSDLPESELLSFVAAI